jgi:tetratricopeptide (TPR) repeat protein
MSKQKATESDQSAPTKSTPAKRERTKAAAAPKAAAPKAAAPKAAAPKAAAPKAAAARSSKRPKWLVPNTHTIADVAAYAAKILPGSGTSAAEALAELSIFHIALGQFELAAAALNSIQASDYEAAKNVAHVAAHLARAGQTALATDALEKAKRWLNDVEYASVRTSIELWVIATERLLGASDRAFPANLEQHTEAVAALTLSGELAAALELLQQGRADTREAIQVLLERGDVATLEAWAPALDSSSVVVLACVEAWATTPERARRGWQLLKLVSRDSEKLLGIVFAAEGDAGVNALMEPEVAAAMKAEQHEFVVLDLLPLWSLYSPRAAGELAISLTSEQLLSRRVWTSSSFREKHAVTLGRAINVGCAGAREALEKFQGGLLENDVARSLLESLEPSDPLWQQAFERLVKPENTSCGDWGSLFAAFRRSAPHLEIAKQEFGAFVEQARATRHDEFRLLKLEDFASAMASIGEWETAESLRRNTSGRLSERMTAKFARLAFASGEISAGLALLAETKGGHSTGERHHEVLQALINILGGRVK